MANRKPTKNATSAIKANVGRGEVVAHINGKTAKFVPNFRNVAAIEDHFDSSLFEVCASFYAENTIRVSKLVPFLSLLNDNDDVTEDELYEWVADNSSTDRFKAQLANLNMALVDPSGRKFTRIEVPEEEEAAKPAEPAAEAQEPQSPNA